MDSSNFDHLAKQLAATTSRREALRLLGGTLAAGALATLLPGRTWAAGGGNSACAHFCASVFGADTAAADQCTSDAAHHQGLCYTCGPAAPPSNGMRLCGQTCITAQQCCTTADCTNGQVCAGNTCQFCSSDSQCGAGQVCQNGGCFSACPSGSCGGSCTTNCSCDVSTDSSTQICVNLDAYVGPCHSNADCPQGSICDSYTFAAGYTANLCTLPCPCP